MDTYKDPYALDQPLDEDDLNQPVSHIYKIKPQYLQKIFETTESVINEALMRIDQETCQKIPDKVAAIVKKLASDPSCGIAGDDEDLFRRKRVFGVNKRPTPPTASMIESIVQTLKNILWFIIILTSVLSGLASVFFGEWLEVWEALSIIFVVIFLIGIIVITDYQKDQQFISLSNNIKELSVPVMRGKIGSTQSLSVWDVVVGDIVLLEQGDMVPADCLIIDAQDLQVDEPAIEEDGKLTKATTELNKNEESPELLAGSIIRKGQCKAIVCCVGELSSRGIKEAKLETDLDTPVQIKLKNLEKKFVLIAILACLLVLVVLVIMLVIKLTGPDPWYKAVLKHSLEYANLIVVLFVVVVPEGLPLTIGVSLAYTTGRMFSEDRILVKKLDAPEKMGEVDEILVGKTGTITTGDMKVRQFVCEFKDIQNSRKTTVLNCELDWMTLDLIKESILWNCSARVEMGKTKYKAVGNQTEVGLINFLWDADIPVQNIMQQKHGRIITTVPFNSTDKISSTVVNNPNRPGFVTIYLKGAPEYVLGMCQTIQGHGKYEILNDDMATDMNERIKLMASHPYRVMAFAYAEMDTNQWNEQFKNTGKEMEFEQALKDRSIQFTFLGAFGMKDRLRDKVQSVVNAVKYNGYVNVRMISGDHIETARAVAIKAGILNEEDLGKEADGEQVVMLASDFRRLCGSLDVDREDEADEGQKMYLTNQETFVTKVFPHVKVLARANSDDKLLMTVGLKNSNRVVAVTGDGINDIGALESADVGLAMGSGCAAAKQASSLILADDDFESAIRAVMWGRNIYQNVSRFLQFQLTVNVSVMLLVLFGIGFFGESPLNPVQLLWVNLIMDTFAAIALSTEPPMEKILQQRPASSRVLTPAVWRQVIGVSLWNFFIILSIMVVGPYMGDFEYFHYYAAKTTTSNDDERCDFTFDEIEKVRKIKKEDQALAEKCEPYWGGQMKNKLFTYILVTFVFMQVFNYFNCRKVGEMEKKVFERIFKQFNVYFWVIVIFVAVAQVLMVQWFYFLTSTVPLRRSEWGACVFAGSTVLIVAFFLKFCHCLLGKIPCTKYIDEDKTTDVAVVNKLMEASQAEVTIPTPKMGGRTPKKAPDTFEDPKDDDFKPM